MTRFILTAVTIAVGHVATAADPAPKPAEFKPKLAHKIEGHTSDVAAIAFSPDGTRLATASKDKTVRIWDVKTGQRKVRIDIGAAAYAIAFSPDGKKVAVGSFGGAMAVYDAETGDGVGKGFALDDSVVLIQWSPDGKLLAAVTFEGYAIRLLDADTGKEKLALKGHTKPVNNVAFAPDGGLIASVGDDSTIRVWDPKTGKEKDSFKQHDGQVYALAFSADGKTLVTGGEDRTVIRWDIKTGNIRKPVMELPKEDHGGLAAVGELPDGTIWTASWGWGYTVVDPADGRLLARKPSFDGRIAWGVGKSYHHKHFALCPDGKHYAVADGKTVWLMDASKSFGGEKKKD